LFDNLVRRRWSDNTSQVVGLRYFNVYGPREAHKGRMASVAFHFFNQYRAEGRVKLFEGSGGFDAGEQRRDFVAVQDVVNVNLYFLDHPQHSGIFNLGTGRAQNFNQVAVATINAVRESQGETNLELEQMRAQGLIEYTAFPAGLKEKYQSYTQADIERLRRVAYAAPLSSVEQGVGRYVKWLLEN
jgi:ADP-L-glycero-D-manno-heptose 6-epimerase